MKPSYIYDISGLYGYLECDGINFIRKEDKQILSPVINLEFAAIFEIGRLMCEKSISF
jgi:hypothetical protein